MSQREEIQNFEKGRIQALQEERLHIQKKTFTKWVNSFLIKVRMEVDDLFVDLSDGRKLLKLLEIISGEKLGKPSNGKMRVHKIENVNKSLAFLLTKVRLESIGAEDIVDGNRRLILGLIWTIILRFQIQEIIDGDEDSNSEKKSAREALLLWCQRKTAGYNGVEIKDFSNSWRNGLGFNALIHAHRPDLIDFDNLNPSKHIENLNNAFDIAHRDLGVTKLLDAEDIDVNKPDEKSVMTYVATYYHKFAKMKTEMKGGRRIANMVGQMMDIENNKNYYETFTTTLLDWITAKIAEIEDRNFPNTLDGIQAELLKFKKYRTEEKPPKYRERSEIEAMLFSIQTKLKYLNQPLFNPPEGKLVHDIERAWQLLEKAEHRREVDLRNALLQQEKLEQLAYKFERKSVLREGYLKEMVVVLSDPRYGSNIVQVEATIKKHEAISADILARADRFQDLSSMAKELSDANYHRRDAIVEREKVINEKWKMLLQLLEKHRQTLHSYSSLMTLVREADATVAEIKALEATLSSDEFGKHLIAIEDLVQKRALMESQIAIHGETVRRLNNQGAEFIANGHKDGAVLQKRLDKMNTEFKRLTDLCKAQQEQLESMMKLMEFIEDHEEEEAWVKEKQQICRALISGKDLRAVISLQQKHKILENEMKARYPKSEQLFKIGEALIANSLEPADVKSRVSSLQDHWKKLQELASKRTKQLEDAVEAYQFYADANEAESWMNEKLSLVTSEDYGKDESSGESQLQRHKNLENEIKAYVADIQRLNEQADSLAKDGITSLSLSGEAPVQIQEIEEDYVEEIQLVPVEEEVKETFYREVIKDVTQEHRVPQLQALYPFNGQGIEMSKGEIMVLVHKTNEDWWNVRKSNGREGFVPALYVKEIEPKVFRKTVQKPVKVPETRIIKKIVNKKQLVRRKVQRSPRLTGKSLRLTQSRPESETILQRQQQINDKYDQLNHLSNKRRLFLEDAIRLFGFSYECDDFENWMKEKEKLLTGDDGTDTVEARKRKFEQFLTDLSACSGRLDGIDKMAEELYRTNHSQMNAIRNRQKHIHDRLARLNRLKLDKERSIQGATSVELFNRNCDEACEWMQEKMNKLDTDDLGMDLKTVQALQRKHQNLERELAPVEEKVKKINQMANSVTTNYPLEKGNVEARQVQLQQMWEEVQKKAKERRSRLEEAVGLLAFNNSSKTLLSWAETIKQTLNTTETASDVQTAQHLLKVHGDLNDDIKAHESEFIELEQLGAALMRANPDNNLDEKMMLLHNENQAILNGWKSKEAQLQQSLKLQFFNREADQIDAMTGSHETFLEFSNLGLSIDEVNALIKSHDDFENTLIVHDERLKIFSDTSNKLVQEGHEKSDYINDRRNHVLQRRAAVKEKSHQRKGMLLESRAYHEFAANAQEMSSWIQEKLRTAKDESYKDLNNLERKLKKHEAFESELKANEGRLRDINSVGAGLITEGHYATDSIRNTLDDLNLQWAELGDLARDKSEKLQQATALHLYNKTIDDVDIKLKNIESDLNSNEIGADMQGINYLLKRHEALENDLKNLQNKAGDLTNLGEKMAKEGHYDAEGILNESEVIKEKCAILENPVRKRREQLETALELHKFIFEVDAELQWVTEHLPLATNRDVGQSLLEVQNLMKKQQKLEWELSGHQPVIDKVLTRGKQLIEDGHNSSDIILAKCLALTESWDGIGELTNERKNKLMLSLRAQQFFHEANELEAWMNEKNDLLQSQDYGKDEDAAVKLLTKQKALELEVDTYSALIDEIGNQAQNMIDAKHPDMKMIQSRQQLVAQEMKTLQKLAVARRMKLMESRLRHEYFRESEELEKWINEQMQTAKSEDFGQDYEHVIILQNKFDDFKQRVDNNSERFTQCEDLANKLLSHDTPYSGDIQHRQEQLTKAWSYLLEQIELRGQKLASATEIHCFNKDVSETLFRIQEKYAAISDDLGRDVNSAMSLLRKHEGFENDLVPLEARLQVLLDDSAQLQMTYQGRNAEHISEQQAVFLENWGTLQERSTKRKKELQASCDLQRFLASVRDLTNWANSLRLDIMTEEKVRDVNGAKTLYYEHERIKVEIKAREESFGNVVRSGQTMVSDQHYASEEIANKLQQLLDARENLHAAWQRKHVFLEQLIDLHFFLRDAKQLDTTSSSQESYLTKIVIGLSVEEVAAQVKKLDEFEILVLAQDEKLAALQDQAMKLIEQQHYDSANVQTKMEDVTMHRARVKESFRNQKGRMADILLYKHFDRDVAEAESWIDEKMKKLNAENLTSNVASLEAKIKKLQKHQAFQSELTANKQRIMFIQENGEKLLSKRHEESPRIRRQLDQLMQDWKKLLLESENRGKGLEEAQDILEFNNQIEKVEAWIREKDLMVQANDVGRDYEHCLALMKRLEDAGSDMQIDDSRMQNINALADKIIRQGRSDTRSIQQRREEVNQKWRGLQGAFDNYQKHLKAALELHKFSRDCDELDERINEKAIAVSVEDTGKDLSGVETLQRKLDALESEITTIETKLKEQDLEARKLIQKYPEKAAATRKKHSEVQENWRNLLTKCHARKNLLQNSHTLQKFYARLHEIQSWVEVMRTRMNENLLAKDIPSAKHQLELHQERKAEIDGRQEGFRSLKEFGHRILMNDHYAKEEVEEQLTLLEELRRTVIQAWEEKNQILSQCLDLQKFYNMADKCDTWIASKEAFLNNEDFGDSISSVEVLIRKHEGFEKTVDAQSGQISALEKFSTELIAYKHYASGDIQDRLQQVCQRQDRLKELAKVRQNKLRESKQLQHFLRNIHEVFGWIHEKQITASDENYLDSTNLQGKIEKHQVFEAELMANKNRVDAVNQEGESLIGAGHFAAMEVQMKLDELEALWRKLFDSTQLKKERLYDAYQALLLTRTLDEIDAWMDDVEKQLQSEDHGEDLNSVQKLLKKHQHLEATIHSQSEQMEQAKDKAANLCNNNHFMKEEIQERIQLVDKRFSNLHEPVQIRKDNLEEALQLQQLLRDVDDELSWIREKEWLASSSDLGNSLTAVQNLQKKHHALEAEIQVHEPVIQSVVSRGQQMIRNNHFASQAVEKAMQNLLSQLQQLKDTASIRRLRLLDAVESQLFYTEINEALTWVEDKKQILSSGDFGKDQESVQVLLKKHDGLQRDIEGFGSNVGRLNQISQRLIDRGHFDVDVIKRKQLEVDEAYNEIQKLSEMRRRRLSDSKKLFKFLNDTSDVAEWINEQAIIVSSEDNGRDLEHVEILIQKFDKFLSILMASEVKVTNITQLAQSLIDSGHPEPEKIRYKADEILQLWDDLKDDAQQRKEELAGAKEVHTFDRKADETITWILEKQASLSSFDSDSDLEAIQILIRKHESYERDLVAVKDQVEFVIEQASQLIINFPNAQDHIKVKSSKSIEVWNTLLEAAAIRKEQLNQAESLQAYFNNCKELLSWLAEVRTKIEATELARDVSGMELLISRHKEIEVEINSRKDALKSLIDEGQHLINEEHFMSERIQKMVTLLSTGLEELQESWKRRDQEYQVEHDRQLFYRSTEQHLSWVKIREPIVNDDTVGSSINEVEDLIRKHEDFEKTLQAQDEKIKEIQRTTLIEEVYNRRRRLVEEEKKLESLKREQERLDALKKKEQQKILDERRNEGERRRTQEIKFNKELVEVPLNGDSHQSHSTSQERINRVGQGQSGASSPLKALSRRGSFDISESLKLSIPKNITEPGPNLRRVESMRMDAFLKSNDSNMSVKRAESMKDDGQKRIKQRVPSFSTRKRSSSKGHKHAKEEVEHEMPPVEMKGVLERKQEFQNGGKKATIRSWKTYFTILCGQLMCFFKDEYDFIDNKAASQPLNIHNASCTLASNYTKKKNVFRLHLSDGADYLFAVEKADLMEEWVKKLDFYASIPPSMQLISYGTRRSVENNNQSSSHSEGESISRPRQNSASSVDSYSSATEDPKVAVNPSGDSTLTTRSSGRMNERNGGEIHIYANVPVVGSPSVPPPMVPSAMEKVKPPVPIRTSSFNSYSAVINENVLNNNNRSSVPYSEVDYYHSALPLSPDNDLSHLNIGIRNSGSGRRQHLTAAELASLGSPKSTNYNQQHRVDEVLPPMPVSQPPSLLNSLQRPPSNMSSYTSEDTEDDWPDHNGDENHESNNHNLQFDGQNNYSVQPASLPVSSSFYERQYSGSGPVPMEIRHSKSASISSTSSPEKKSPPESTKKKKWWHRK